MGTTPYAPAAEVAGYRERIAGTWEGGDPTVLAFEGDGMPIVADVDGDLRYLSYHLVRPRSVSEAALEKFITLRGPPTVLSLSAHPAGYDPRLLRMRPF